ncbi:hypothetical protein L1049_025932 [Liquidambar formosana]|uniref:SWI/SNF complex subunit SWI3B n=1 Tax=Liquidambar formosana TaxID=63359 RepID=A0AAP0NCQ2_LIQFO
MATKSPVKDLAGPSTETTPKQLESSPTPPTPAVKLETPVTDSKKTAAAVSSRPPEPPSTDANVVNIPSYSRWFSWNDIHECEVRFLPEFFDSRSPSKNPRVYKYYRNSIVRKFRENPSRKVTFTDARKTLVGDVGSIRRVFDFLEAWGLVNYSGAAIKLPLKWEEKESKSGGAPSQSSDPAGSSIESSVPTRKWCSGCKSLCNIACFACDKFDLTLCARCYVRGNYRVGVSSSDFRRVEINEETKSDWTDKETLHLLEAILHYGDDWKKVAEHVGGRSEKECVTRFIKFPFGEVFVGHPDSGEIDNKFDQIEDQGDAEFGLENVGTLSPRKRVRLTPLADASNPIMAQAAFLSALAGVEVAEAAAQAAVKALSEVDYRTSRENHGSLNNVTRHQESDVPSNGDSNLNASEGACVDVNSLLEKEELDVERAISGITEVQMKEIQEKIIHFEEFEIQMEKEWKQLQQVKSLLFADQLSLLFHKTAAPKSGENMREEDVKTD